MRSRFVIRALTLPLSFGLLVGVGACHRAGPASAAIPADAVTTLRVVNERFLDADVYVLPENGARIRLGTAGGNKSTILVIPRSLIFGASEMRFVADPIGGAGASRSESVMVSRGDQVTLTITP